MKYALILCLAMSGCATKPTPIEVLTIQMEIDAMIDDGILPEYLRDNPLNNGATVE